MNEDKAILKFEDLVIGLKVIDNDGWVGHIKECTDIHNVIVTPENSDKEDNIQNLYCLVEGCELYDPLYKN